MTICYLACIQPTGDEMDLNINNVKLHIEAAIMFFVMCRDCPVFFLIMHEMKKHGYLDSCAANFKPTPHFTKVCESCMMSGTAIRMFYTQQKDNFPTTGW